MYFNYEPTARNVNRTLYISNTLLIDPLVSINDSCHLGHSTTETIEGSTCVDPIIVSILYHLKVKLESFIAKDHPGKYNEKNTRPFNCLESARGKRSTWTWYLVLILCVISK